MKRPKPLPKNENQFLSHRIIVKTDTLRVIIFIKTLIDSLFPRPINTVQNEIKSYFKSLVLQTVKVFISFSLHKTWSYCIILINTF